MATTPMDIISVLTIGPKVGRILKKVSKPLPMPLNIFVIMIVMICLRGKSNKILFSIKLYFYYLNYPHNLEEEFFNFRP